jgi:hypothetical protein
MAAMQDVEAAFMLARRGRQFSEIEEKLSTYFFFYQELQDVIAGRKSSIFKFMEEKMLIPGKATKEVEVKAFNEMCERHYSKIVLYFMDAVNNRDSQKIMEIAHAIEFLKFFEEKGDRYRAEILHFKILLEHKCEKWPIRKVAEKIGWPDKVGADGFKQLRRMCNELNFPLAESKHKANKTQQKAYLPLSNQGKQGN